MSRDSKAPQRIRRRHKPSASWLLCHHHPLTVLQLSSKLHRKLVGVRMREPKPVFNPFYGVIKADDLDIADVQALFVEEASPIWGAVHEPLHQIVRGPRGAGKTMLLKRMHGVHRTYTGIYIQVSRIANIFRHPFDRMQAAELASTHWNYQRAFADYIILEIVKESAKLLGVAKAVHDRVSEATLSLLADRVMKPRDPQDLVAGCIDLQRHIESNIEDWEIAEDCNWRPLFEPTASLQRIGATAKQIFAASSGSATVFLLIDESAPIPEGCQQVINTLLQRGREFKTKLAIRPYEWETLTTSTGVTIEAGTDFQRLDLEYPDEMTDPYIQKAKKIVDSLLHHRLFAQAGARAGWPPLDDISVTDIFPSGGKQLGRTHQGFRDICALSSSNPQNLIGICSAIFGAACEEGEIEPGKLPSVPKYVQHQAMAAWATDYEESIPDLAIQSLVRAVLKRLETTTASGKGITIEVRADTPSLFDADHLPGELASDAKAAFSLGLLRVAENSHLPWNAVPARFSVSRSLLPCYDIPLRVRREPPTEIATSFIEKYLREDSSIRSSGRKDDELLSSREIPAFLSTSFSPLREEERVAIKEALAEAKIECYDLQDMPRGQFLYGSILKGVKDAEVVILNATEPRPFTLFEVGLCAGRKVPIPVICVFNDDNDPERLNRLPEFMKVLDIVSFSFTQGRLLEMASAVRAAIERLLQEPSEFVKVAHTGISLRPRRTGKTIYLADAGTPIWARAASAVKKAIESKGYSLIREPDYPVVGTNRLQKPIPCASLAGLAIVDTSGTEAPDLLQAYKFGVLQARDQWPVLRVEERGKDHKDAFASVPADYQTWSTTEELVSHVLDFIERNKG